MYLQDIQAEIDAHNDIYKSVEGNKSKMVKALGSSEEAVFLQHRLDDMNQRWSDLKAKSANIRSVELPPMLTDKCLKYNSHISSETPSNQKARLILKIYLSFPHTSWLSRANPLSTDDAFVDWGVHCSPPPCRGFMGNHTNSYCMLWNTRMEAYSSSCAPHVRREAQG